MSETSRFLEFQILDDSSDLAATIRITELGNGTLLFNIDLSEGVTVGDLRAIFFDISDPTLLASLSAGVGVGDVTDEEYDNDDVSNLGQGTNINGEVVGELGEFDAGVELGTPGISQNDIRSTSFILESSATNLTLDLFEGQDFGLRINSVGTEDGSRNSSLKISGTSAIAPNHDDLRTNMEDGTTLFDGSKDDASDFNFNILANDGGSISTEVQSVNGQSANLGAVLLIASADGRTGQITVNADGSVNFDPLANFNDLAQGQTDTLTFAYTVSQSDSTASTSAATVSITVIGTNDAPVVNSSLSTNTSEDAASFSIDLLEGASDADEGETASLSIANVAGLVAGLSLIGTTLNVNPSDASFQDLAFGESRTLEVTYDVVDAQGAAVAQSATVTITGTNDAPVIVAALFAAAAEDDPSFTLDLLAGATDIDNGETSTLSITNVTGLTAGITLAGTILTVDPSDAAFQSLNVGDSLIISVDFDIVDAQGTSVPQTATITIIGTNDGPPLFTAGNDIVTFDDVVAGSYEDGTQYFAGDGNDQVFLPTNALEAAEAGYVIGTTFNAGEGNDTVVGGDLDDIVVGGSIQDVLIGRGGNDQLFGEGGNDGLAGNLGDDLIDGGDGNDTASFGFNATSGVVVNLTTGTSSGGDGNDILVDIENITTGQFDDTLIGNAGANILQGGNGDDILQGMGGNDIFRFEGGEDTIDGGSGFDRIEYNSSANGITFDFGLGTVIAGLETDQFSNIEQIFGTNFTDVGVGDNQNNHVVLFGGNDTFTGLGGNDIIDGGIGDDTLDGGADNDTIQGRDGADLITGGTGNDTMVGGTGDDTFFFAAGSGNDLIFDFVAGAGSDDILDVSGYAFTFATLGDFLTANATDFGPDVVIQLSASDSIELRNVNIVDLSEDDFLF